MSANKPFDVFISFKDLDDNNKRTEASKLAENLYMSLSARNCNPFFSRETLRNYTGQNFRVLIDEALESAKVMLLVFDDPNFLWKDYIKYEWGCFLKRGKRIIPVFLNISGDQWRQVPEAIRNLQCVDMTNDDGGFKYEDVINAVMTEFATARPAQSRTYTGTQQPARSNSFDLSDTLERIKARFDQIVSDIDLPGKWDIAREKIKESYANNKNVYLIVGASLVALILFSSIGKAAASCSSCGKDKPSSVLPAPPVGSYEENTSSDDSFFFDDPVEESTTTAPEPSKMKSDSVKGSVVKGTDREYYFEATNNGIHRISLLDRTSNINVRMDIYDANGNRVESRDNTVAINVNGTGRFRIVLRTESETECGYTLKINRPDPVVTVKDLTKSIHGAIRFESQQNQYLVTTPRPGVYRFDCTNRTNGINVKLRVYDSNNERRLDATNGGHCELEANVLYTVIVEYVGDVCEYDLVISMPNPVLDISGKTQISDEIRFVGQSNQYTYTAAVDGEYRFECTDRTDGHNVALWLFDSNGERVIRDATNSGNAVLTKGSKYTVYVDYRQDFCTYNLVIGVPHEIVDIDPASPSVKDQLTYEGQKNQYTFKPSKSGEYFVSAKNRTNDYKVGLYMEDSNRSRVLRSTNEGIVKLESGMLYIIIVSYDGNPCEYTLDITPHNGE